MSNVSQSDVSQEKGPWTWPERAKRALLLILTREQCSKTMDQIGSYELASKQTVDVPIGRGEEVAIVLNNIQPDEGYCAEYGVFHKGSDAIVIYSKPYKEVT